MIRMLYLILTVKIVSFIQNKMLIEILVKYINYGRLD